MEYGSRLEGGGPGGSEKVKRVADRVENLTNDVQTPYSHSVRSLRRAPGERGYVRRNHRVPLPQAQDLGHLNQLLRAGSREEEQRVSLSVGHRPPVRPRGSSANTCNRWLRHRIRPGSG